MHVESAGANSTYLVVETIRDGVLCFNRSYEVTRDDLGSWEEKRENRYRVAYSQLTGQWQTFKLSSQFACISTRVENALLTLTGIGTVEFNNP